jgi:hypothetical protein
MCSHQQLLTRRAPSALGLAELDKTADASPFILAATTSSGLPVYFNIVYGPAVLNNNTVTLLGAGGDGERIATWKLNFQCGDDGAA